MHDLPFLQVKRNKELIAVNIVDVLCIQHELQQQQPAQQPPPQQQQLDSGCGVSDSTTCNVEVTRVNNALIRNVNGKTESFSDSNGGTNTTKYQGFVAVLKENFGFIETIQHDEEVFFHFSNFIGNPNNLELGQEVEYTLSKRNGSNSGNCWGKDPFVYIYLYYIFRIFTQYSNIH